MKDWVKINFLKDRKTAQEEANHIKFLIQNHMYPQRFLMPLTLQFELTSRCNVHCKHCYNLSGSISSNDAMTPQKWKDFARYIINEGGGHISVRDFGRRTLTSE